MSFAISFVPKWKEFEPKSIHPKSMWRARARAFAPLLLAQTRLDAFARSLQLSADGSVIWLQEGGGYVPPPSRFWGKMAAVALLLVPMVHMNQREQETHWKHGVASTVTRTQHCICCVSRIDECYTNAFTSLASLRCYPLALCCPENLRVWLLLEWSGCLWEARMSRFVRFVCANWGNRSVLQAKINMFHSFLKHWNYQVNKCDFISVAFIGRR